MGRSLKDIVRAAAMVTGSSPQYITSPAKYRECIVARAAICIVAREHGYTKSAIGKTLAKDHTTVIHSLREFGDDPAVVFVADAMRAKLAEPTWRERCRDAVIYMQTHVPVERAIQSVV